ncbi:hypothetical protein G7Y89_g3902 [Cudoniella acicularis]|uniref:Mmc1 C-terminal domain-containing protein n=1 Tax=Cudoniella acicularis TaxID=354080 RepID=A0A8H4W561_9HELO|nr:hypothetical protein G7Y89_g3902 [Cudoniella acicularis]
MVKLKLPFEPGKFSTSSITIVATMSPRVPRVGMSLARASRMPIVPKNSTICPMCTFSRTLRHPPSLRPRKTAGLRKHRISSRSQTTFASASNSVEKQTTPTKHPRAELHEALLELQKHAGNYINISRLQLALRGLDQPPGQETIRIAILGLADGGKSLKTAKELLRLLLADPLKAEEEWERILLDSPPGSRPILLKVGHDAAGSSTASPRMVQELNASSPLLNGHKLEILVLETDSPQTISIAGAIEEAILVPTMEIPTSNTGRYTPVTTPVHKSLLVSKGLAGAASLMADSIQFDRDLVGAAVDIQVGNEEEKSTLPFQIVDVALASSALSSFRESVHNALDYEQRWFASGAPEVLEWLKSGTSPADGAMKVPVRKLIESLLDSTNAAIQVDEASRLNSLLASKITPSSVDSLRKGLYEWAETAHTELRDQLDIAFNGHRWRKLGWWKLFWRVDDVSMIASDILHQRFLPEAEKEVIFLAGRIVEAGIFRQDPESIPADWAYKPVQRQRGEAKLGTKPLPVRIVDIANAPDVQQVMKSQPWPLNIPATRRYLATDTVPALQALAQKLVLQTLTTSSFVSALAALTYVSSLSTGLYEAGGIAAVGIVWSLRRMQGKWETARKFWEGEVREEGRKAVRGVENTVGDVLKISDRSVEEDPELEKAKELVNQADAALRACK